MSLIKVAAIHEAAHIVIACYYGYPPIEVFVTEVGIGGFSANYGCNYGQALKLIETEVNGDTFTIVDGLDEDIFMSNAQDFFMILIAGGVAEAVYRSTSTCSENSQIELRGKDLRQAEAISKYLGVDIEEEKKDMYKCLQGEAFWKAIIHLSEKIMLSEGLRLNHEQIKSSLVESGFISFMGNCLSIEEVHHGSFDENGEGERLAL